MNYSDDILQKTKQFGVLGYNLEKCLNILDFTTEDEANRYRDDFETDGSPIAVAYSKGVDYRDFAFDTKLFDMAKGGDMKAMATFENRLKARKIR